MLVGAGLAVAGATFQGIVRNPLADPYVLGTASGAALGAALAILLPVGVVVFQFGLVNVLAFVGALVAAFVVFRLGGRRSRRADPAAADRLRGRVDPGRAADDGDVRLRARTCGRSSRSCSAASAGASWSAWSSPRRSSLGGLPPDRGARPRSLDGLLLGDAAAGHLGVDVRRERGILLVLASMATAAAVAISGLIGFVGLVVPHVVRLLVGPGARRVVPISAIVGAVLLAAADLVARLLGDIPVGVVMAILGAPFFLVLLRRTAGVRAVTVGRSWRAAA